MQKRARTSFSEKKQKYPPSTPSLRPLFFADQIAPRSLNGLHGITDHRRVTTICHASPRYRRERWRKSLLLVRGEGAQNQKMSTAAVVRMEAHMTTLVHALRRDATGDLSFERLHRSVVHVLHAGHGDAWQACMLRTVAEVVTSCRTEEDFARRLAILHAVHAAGDVLCTRRRYETVEEAGRRLWAMWASDPAWRARVRWAALRAGPRRTALRFLVCCAQIYDEVTYRPGNRGYEACKAAFCSRHGHSQLKSH